MDGSGCLAGDQSSRSGKPESLPDVSHARVVIQVRGGMSSNANESGARAAIDHLKTEITSSRSRIAKSRPYGEWIGCCQASLSELKMMAPQRGISLRGDGREVCVKRQ